MNGFLALLFLALLSAAFLSSCDECYQCDVYPEPYVNVKFIKRSDLELVKDTIATLIEQLAEERKNEAALTADAPPEQNEEVEEAEIRPEIQLYGIVEGLAVVQVLNNEVRFMEAGDQTEGISVQRIYTDSVEFRFNEELFTLKLE